MPRVEELIGTLQTGSPEEKEVAVKELRLNALQGVQNKVAIAEAGALPPLIDLLKSGTPGTKELAAGALRDMVGQKGQNVGSIAEAGAIPPLIEILKSGTPGAKEEAAGALKILGYWNAENRISMGETGAILPLVELLKSGTPGAQEQAAGALRNLAFYVAAYKLSIAEAGAIPLLVELLKSGNGTPGTKQHAAWALRDLVGGRDLAVSITQAGAIPPLVEQLKCRTPSAVASQEAPAEVAAKALMYFADFVGENRVSIANAGAIPPLIELVKSGNSVGAGTREWASGALRALVTDNAENRVSIAKAGAIPLFVDLLGSGPEVIPPKAKAGVALTLRILAVDEEMQLSIAKAGAIPPLTELLKSDARADVKEQAAGLFWDLAKNAENKVTIAQAGAIPVLRDLLDKDPPVITPKGKVNAANALEILPITAAEIAAAVKAVHLGTPEEKEAAAQSIKKWVHTGKASIVEIVQAGTIPVLAAMLKKGTPTAQEAATETFQVLSVHAESARSLALAVPGLVALLLTGTPKCKEVATQTLRNLGAHEAQEKIRNEILKQDATAVLVDLLESSAEDTSAAALVLLGSLAASAPGALATAGAIPKLIALLQGNIDMATAAAAALWSLAVRPEHRAEIADAIQVLADELLVSSSRSFQAEAAGILWNLSAGPSNKERMADAGAITGLANLLQNGSLLAKEAAAAALRNLAVHDGNRSLINHAGAVAQLVALLWDRSPFLREKAVGALRNLAEDEECRDVINGSDASQLLKDLGQPGRESEEVQLLAADTLRVLAQKPPERKELADGGGPRREASELQEDVSLLEPWVKWDLMAAGEIPPEWSDYPSYWKFQGDESEVTVTVTKEEKEVMSQLLTNTFIPVKTGDRKDRRMPKQLQFIHCVRVQNKELWRKYATVRWMMHRKYGGSAGGFPPTPVQRLTKGEVQTGGALSATLQQSLRQKEVNEVFLFHGTSPVGADGISKNGFDLQFVGTGAGTMFGPGFYLAERSSKSDEYAREDGGINKGKRSLILCRAALGEILHASQGGGQFFEGWQKLLQINDSLLGDREAVVGTYREFVVYHPNQVYPEYIIHYERDYEEVENEEADQLAPDGSVEAACGNGGLPQPLPEDSVAVASRPPVPPPVDHHVSSCCTVS